LRLARALAWLVPLVVAAALLSVRIAEPWIGSYDANGALFSTAARNYLRYGLAATRGGQVVNAGELTPERFRVHAHHPPGISLLVAGSFALLGEAEWTARLVAIVFTLGAAACVFVVARELRGSLAAFLATLAFVLQPMIAFYGRMPHHQAPGLFFSLLVVVFYLRWRKARGAWPLVGMCGAVLVGTWCAWMVFVVPWLLLGFHLVTERRGWRALLVVVAAAMVGSGGVATHIAVLKGGLGELIGALAHRVGSAAADRGPQAAFGLLDFAHRQLLYATTAFSPVAWLLVMGWVAGLGRRGRSEWALLGALALFGLANVLGFKQGAFVHIYYQFYLSPFVALAAGFALEGIWRRGRGLLWPILAGCLVLGMAGDCAWRLARIHRAVFYTEELAVARALRRATAPADKVLVVWDHRSTFRQLAYYADRDLVVVADRRAAVAALERDGFTQVAEVDDVVRVVPAAKWLATARSGRRPGRPR